MADIYKSPAQEQLLLLRDLTQRTQMLHEAQVLQLRMWPRVMFNVKEVDLQVDFPKKRIVFKLGAVNKKKAKLVGSEEERAKQVAVWTKWLLGDDWIVEIHTKEEKYRFGLIL